MTCRISVKPFGPTRTRGLRRVELVLSRTGGWLCRESPATEREANAVWRRTSRGAGWLPPLNRIRRFAADLDPGAVIKAFEDDAYPADAAF